MFDLGTTRIPKAPVIPLIFLCRCHCLRLFSFPPSWKTVWEPARSALDVRCKTSRRCLDTGVNNIPGLMTMPHSSKLQVTTRQQASTSDVEKCFDWEIGFGLVAVRCVAMRCEAICVCGGCSFQDRQGDGHVNGDARPGKRDARSAPFIVSRKGRARS